MADNKMLTNVQSPPEQAKPTHVDQRAQQSQASAAAKLGEHTSPGRRPLFRQ